MLERSKARTLEGAMGIDRIGKGGAPPPSTPPVSPKGAGPSDRVRGPEPSRPFEVRPERAAESAKASQIAPTGMSPLERLRAGQIDVNGYVDLKVEQATAHLEGLSPVELGSVKSMLRNQIVSDPALADLVKQATGSAPTPREE
jgi:hypothetical protein